MAGREFLRVVCLRRGKLKVSEFRLRPGERGLSLFRRVAVPSPGDIVAAVRAAGKQGDLAVALLTATDLSRLGLRILATPGGTGDEVVNAVHVEARLSRWRILWLRLSGVVVDEYFNDRFSEALLAASRLS